MKKIEMKIAGDILMIGEDPQFIVNLKNQENYIKVQQKKIPYRRVISLSSDLLAEKRENVLNTAVQHYYRQACAVAEGMAAAEEYRSRVNTTVRERK